MYLVFRAILIASLLLQPFAGLLPQRCVGMPDAAALVSMGMPAGATCDCCGGDADGASVECPMAKDSYVGCNCKASQQEAPQTPPPGPEHKPLTQLLAFVPVLIMLVPEPAARSFVWHGDDALLRRSSPSIQSLLCVWLM
ncbi:MAG: hypothetical protein AB7G11_03845 [Phycisphaerales bacterium]